MTRAIHSSRIAVALAAFAIVQAASIATAEVPQLKVSYGDLDLSQPADVTAMVQRLNMATTAVCGAVMDASVAMRRHVVQCRRSALQGAVRDINAPLLTARYGMNQTYLTSR